MSPFESRSRRQRERYFENKAKGLCKCGKPLHKTKVTTLAHCQDCLTKMRARTLALHKFYKVKFVYSKCPKCGNIRKGPNCTICKEEP